MVYRVGIVGCGNAGRMHARGWRSLDKVELVAAADFDKENLKHFCRGFGIPRMYTDYRKMLEREDLDILSICTWPSSHAHITIDAANMGVRGILCEKPMCLSLAEADDMIKACEDNNVKLAIGHQHRFDPHNVEARRLISKGIIGKPQLVVCRVMDGLLNNGTHYIDLMRYWLGDPKPLWVIGQLERKTNRYERGIPIEDLCMGLICFEGGTRGLIESDLPYRGISLTPVIYGEDGILTFDKNQIMVLSGESQGWKRILPSPHTDTEFSELIDWIEGKKVHRSNAYEARYTMEIMMAIYESSRSRSLVRLPLTVKENPLHAMIRDGLLPLVKPDKYDIRIPPSKWKYLS